MVRYTIMPPHRVGCDRISSVGRAGLRSEEPESSFVSGAGPSGSGPDHHHRSIEAPTLRKNASEGSGHPLKEGRAGPKPHSGLTQVDGAVAHRLVRIEVPGEHNFD